MSVFAWSLLVYWIVGIIAYVGMVGQPREPVSSGMAAFVVAVQSVWIVALIMHEGAI